MSGNAPSKPWSNSHVRRSIIINVIIGIVNTILVIISRGWITGLNMAIVWAIIPFVVSSSYYYGWSDGQQSRRDLILKFM
jgi:hypothetical protein